MTKKYLFAATLSILFTTSHAYAGSWNGWIYQNPYPTSNRLLAVKFITPQKGWIVGEKGTILYTEDGGENWEAQESGTEHDIKSLAFVNEKQGWAVGNGGVIVHTEDGGKTWISQQSDIKTSLHKVFFISEKAGWTAGDEGVLLYTKNAGKNWKRQKNNTKASIASVFFIDSNTGWFLAGGKIYRTTNGGGKWESNKLPFAPQEGVFSREKSDIPEDWWQGDIFFIDENKGWVVVGLWFIYHTEDGGKTWESKNLGYRSYEARTVSFTDSVHGCIAGNSILCTEDGGKTWNEKLGIGPGDVERISGFLITLWDLSFVNQSIGWAVGIEGEILKTEDGGKNWKIISSRADFYKGSIYFHNDRTGWAVQEVKKVSIVHTEDGGDTWSVQKEFDAAVKLRFFFVNPTSGWAAGYQWEQKTSGVVILHSFILHTTDGGNTWETQFNKPGSDLELLDAFFVNSETGWVVGSKGTILYTKDGGKTWEQQNSETTANLKKVQFVDENTGWIVGVKGGVEERQEGILLFTEDGGQHWQVKLKRKDIAFLDLIFVDKDYGWVTGEDHVKDGHGFILLTKDGGKQWELQNTNKNYLINPFFIDRKNGWFELLNIHEREPIEGRIIITFDGGKTWKGEKTKLHKYPWRPFEPLPQTKVK